MAQNSWNSRFEAYCIPIQRGIEMRTDFVSSTPQEANQARADVSVEQEGRCVGGVGLIGTV